MSEKVKLTREQAEAIEAAITEFGKDRVIDGVLGEWRGELSPLNDLRPSEFARIMYDAGYEVEETFKVRDNVVLDDGKVAEILSDWQCDDRFLVGWIANGSMYKEYVNEKRITRHATKQEVWWAKHGREVWELKQGDILKDKRNGFLYEYQRIGDAFLGKTIRLARFNEGRYDFWKNDVTEHFKVICFAEDRKDVDHA